jgi:hypothetical protein
MKTTSVMVAYRFRLINSRVWDVAVSEHAVNVPRPRVPVLLRVLSGVVLLEAVAMAVVTVLLLIELLTQPVESLPGAIALIVLAALAVVWLLAMFRGILRRRPWTRGAVFTWQLLQLAIAAGSFQNGGRQDIGWLLLIPSVVAIALLFTPSVMNATRRPTP